MKTKVKKLLEINKPNLVGVQDTISKDYIKKQKDFDNHWSDMVEAKRKSFQL